MLKQSPSREGYTEMSLDELVRKIFDIIPSYYDEKEAATISELINQYVDGITKEGRKCSECTEISQSCTDTK